MSVGLNVVLAFVIILICVYLFFTKLKSDEAKHHYLNIDALEEAGWQIVNQIEEVGKKQTDELVELLNKIEEKKQELLMLLEQTNQEESDKSGKIIPIVKPTNQIDIELEENRKKVETMNAQGYSNEEISEKLDIDVGLIKVILSLKRMKKKQKATVRMGG